MNMYISFSSGSEALPLTCSGQCDSVHCPDHLSVPQQHGAGVLAGVVGGDGQADVEVDFAGSGAKATWLATPVMVGPPHPIHLGHPRVSAGYVQRRVRGHGDGFH